MNKNLLEAEVTWLDEVDSTSRVARDYLNHHPKSIRAFAAKKQTAGAGRQGRHWESVDGNLHLSVAFPGELVPEEMRDLLPLAAGIAVIKILERAAGIRPVLKWPNDIVLDGAKLGGILCEATITGGSWNGAIIGIGLNLAKAPDLEEGAEYQAGSILQSTGIRLLPHLVSEALTRQLIQAICETKRAQILDSYRLFSTAPGQLWKAKADGSDWFQERFDDAGHLALKSAAGSTAVLTSADHEYLWSSQGKRTLLVGDVGNTRVKLGIFDVTERGLVHAKQFAWTPGVDDPSLALGFIREALERGAPSVLHLSSVNQQHAAALKEALASSSIFVREISKRALRSFSSRYRLPSIGMDRFVGLEACLALRGQGKLAGPMILVSCGTATTIDFIDEAGIHHGGLIGAGVDLGLNALHLGTAALPMLDGTPTKIVRWTEIPSDTNGAMTSAALRMQAAWVEREWNEWSKHLGTDLSHCRLVMTGGRCDDVLALLSESCQKVVHREPALGLLGVAVLALNGA